MSASRVHIACTCILDKVVVVAPSTSHPPLSTPAIPFCSLAPVTSLLVDPSATPFCQSVRQMPAITRTNIATSIPDANMQTLISLKTDIITNVLHRPSPVFSLETPTVIIKSYGSFCGNGMEPTNYMRKRGIGAPVPTPTYLKGQPSEFVSSACSCMHNLPTPSTAVASVFEPKPSTITTQIVKVVTEEINVSVYSGTTVEPIEASQTVYSTVVTASPLPTGQVQKGTHSKYAMWYSVELTSAVLGSGVMGVYNDIVVGACYCGMGGSDCYSRGSTNSGLNQGFCNGAASCFSICDGWDTTNSMGINCAAVMWDADSEMCFIMHTPDHILMDTDSCGVSVSNNASYIGSYIGAA
ncbi:hypothetical protein ANO11243_042490 [Dothideomycetidae sp. 11243]|nr:hypothetical protein ANO11243_042490 [fungal sp. No.11243]